MYKDTLFHKIQGSLGVLDDSSIFSSIYKTILACVLVRNYKKVQDYTNAVFT